MRNERSDPNRGSVAGAPEVSVVIVAYGRRPFLVNALDSLVRQDLDPSRFEVVLVRNFDAPDIDSRSDRFALRSVRMEAPQKGAMMVAGANAARAPIVAWMDDDDVFVPEKLTAVLDRFHAEPSLVYYHHFRRKIDAHGAAVPTGGPLYARRSLPSGRARQLHRLVGVDFLTDSCTAMRRDLAQTLGPSLSTIEIGTDFALLFGALAAEGSLQFDPALLTEYRIHSTQASDITSSRTFDRTLADVQRIHQYCDATGDRALRRSSAGLLRLMELERTTRTPSSRRHTLACLVSLLSTSNTFIVRSHVDVIKRAMKNLV